jgi:hypothetical protein
LDNGHIAFGRGHEQALLFFDEALLGGRIEIEADRALNRSTDLGRLADTISCSGWASGQLSG